MPTANRPKRVVAAASGSVWLRSSSGRYRMLSFHLIYNISYTSSMNSIREPLCETSQAYPCFNTPDVCIPPSPSVLGLLVLLLVLGRLCVVNPSALGILVANSETGESGKVGTARRIPISNRERRGFDFALTFAR